MSGGIFHSMLFNKCQILHRVKGSGDSWQNYQFTPGKEVSCMYISKTNYRIRDGQGIVIINNGIFLIEEAVVETDRILFDELYYDIVGGGINPKINPLIGSVECYEITVIRRRGYNEDKITVNSGVN